MQTRCPQCSTLLDVEDTIELSKIDCSSCGLSFDLLAGTTVAALRGQITSLGQFELIQQVGSGAFGEVWKARDIELDRFVAIKIPHRQHLVGHDAEQFLREARAAAQLKHNNIVPVFEVGRHRQDLFIVSQFVEGISLEDFLSAKKLSVREASEMTATIAEAMGYAHSLGVIHRDLKPSNILLDALLKPYILDFGLAKRDTGEITVTLDGAILGTPLYMSPEQARGEAHSADARTDIYSLGVILFRLLTGELPFRGNRPMLLHQIVHDDPPMLRSLNSAIPRDMETICMKCLQKDRQKRYATCAELAQDLRSFLHGEPIKARPSGTIEKALRWCQRKPLVASLAGGLTLSLLTGLIAVSWLWQRAKISANRAQASSIQASSDAKRAIEQEKLTNRYLYVAHMNMVQEAWERGLIDRASELLQRQRPELRSFPWFYYHRLTQKSQTIPIFPHSDIVTQIAFSPTQSQIAIGGNNGQFAIWDPSKKSRLFTHDAEHHQLIARMEYSRNGETLVWTGRRGKLIVFETNEYQPIGPERNTSMPWNVAISPDSQHLAFVNEEGKVVLSNLPKHDLERADRVIEEAVKPSCIAFTSDGSRLVIGSGDGSLRAVNANDGKLVGISQYTAGIKSISLSPNSLWLASSDDKGDVALWSIENLNHLQTVPFHSGGIRYLAFSHDSQLLTATGDKLMSVWKTAENKLSGNTIFQTGSIQLICPIPGSHLFAAIIGEDNFVYVFDGLSGREVGKQPGHENSLYGLAVSSDGRFLASGGRESNVRLWDRESPSDNLTIPAHNAWLWTVCFANSGQTLISASADGNIRLWDSTTGKRLGQLRDPDLSEHSNSSHSDSIQFLLVMPDGNTLASASRDGSVKLWSIKDQKLLAHLKEGHKGAVNSVATTGIGRSLFSIGDDGKVVEWDIESRKQKGVVLTVEGAGWALACSKDSTQLAAGGVNRKIVLWDLVHSRNLAEIGSHKSAITSLCYSPDGQKLVSTSADQTVQLHSTADSDALMSGISVKSTILNGHSADTMTAAYSPDGQTLATSGEDRTIRLWDLKTGEAIGLLLGHTQHVHAIAFDSSGTRLASASWDGTVRVWLAPQNLE